jgi:hypothetical protein
MKILGGEIMKNMMKKIMLVAMMVAGVSMQASGPFTTFLKTIWDFPCNNISEEATSALFITSTALLGYEGLKYWYCDANDKLYFIKKWGEGAYNHPQITLVLSLLTVISIGYNNSNGKNKTAEEKKKKVQDSKETTLFSVVTPKK